jgi:DNA-binding transcriptional LysR family regulator
MAIGSEGVSDRFQALQLFVEIARTGSFSKGAKAMRLSQPTASRIIALLEEQLGTILFSRSTRALTLTEAGSAYLARVQPILASLEEADDAVRGSDDIRGTLRVAVSSIFASRIIVPRLRSFVSRYPDLRIELSIDDRRQDLISEGIDVAVRFGKLPDSTTVARLIGRWPLVIAAAPAYLDARGTPGTPEALVHHTFVIAGPLAGRDLVFHQGDRKVRIQPRGQVSIDGAEVAVSAVRAGLGIVQVLADWKLADIEAHALFAGGQAAKPAARAFVNHLVEEVRSS